MSATGINLQEFQESCKLKNHPSTKILHKKGIVTQVESVSEVSTAAYLNKFRDSTGYAGSKLIREEGLSEYEVKPKEDNEETQDKRRSTLDKKEESSFGRTLTLDEIKSGLHGITRTGDGYSYTFTSVRLSGRQLEDPSLVANFCNLKSIDISNNRIKSVRNLGAMPYLQKINAAKNQIDTFLDMTPVPVALKEVDFSYNLITSIVNMKNFWSLTDINLSHNGLTVIEGFSDLEYLQVLNLSYNKIATVVNLDCPNLLILYLNYNCLESISGFLNCNNLRYINLNGNKISKVKGLKYMNELTELHLGDNNIEDISELENLKTLLSLTRIQIHSNPITSLENWRLVLIHMLPQILWMDGQRLEAKEIRMAETIFNPSFRKIAFLDHAAILLDRACQAANTIFDDHCRTRPFPPILLLVGPPKSQCHKMALLLKQRFKNKVYLGGVHSTTTTMEGSNPNVDIPVSFESFKDMKNRGEFLATSQILGRVCGFATSQIARAAEKGALLVAAVPLTTAISLREWNLRPKLVLVLPSIPPEFPQDDERIESIKRTSALSHSGEWNKRPSADEMKEQEAAVQAASPTNQKDSSGSDHHLVNFAETLSIVPSMERDLKVLVYREPKEPRSLSISAPSHSILKTPHFEVDYYQNASPSFLDDDVKEEDEDDSPRTKGLLDGNGGSKGKFSPMFVGEIQGEVDLEKKKRSRLKSLAPGMENYNFDDDEDDDEGDEVAEGKPNRPNVTLNVTEESESKEKKRRRGTKHPGAINSGKSGPSNKVPASLSNLKHSDNSQGTPVRDESKGSTPNVTSRPRRLNRLASLLMLQTDQRLSSSLNITDILMNLPSMEKVDPKLLQTVDLSAVSTLIQPVDNGIISTEQGPIMIVSIHGQNEDGTQIQPRSTLIPPSFSILQDPSPLRAAPVGNQRFVGNYDLMMVREQTKRTKEAEAALRGEKVKTSSDDATTANPGTLPSKKEKKSNPRNKQNSLQEEDTALAKQDNGTEGNNINGEADPLLKTDINQQPEIRNESKPGKKSRKCKHRKSSKCKSRKNKESENKNEPKGSASQNFGETLENKSKGQQSCSKRGCHKSKRLIGPSNAFDWRGREIGEPEETRKANFDRDIKRGVFYDGEFCKFTHEKSMDDADFELSQDSLLPKSSSTDKNPTDTIPDLSNGKLDEPKFPEEKSSGQVEADVKLENLFRSQDLLGNEVSGGDQSSMKKALKKHKKKGLRFEGSNNEDDLNSQHEGQEQLQQPLVVPPTTSFEKSKGLTKQEENPASQQQQREQEASSSSGTADGSGSGGTDPLAEESHEDGEGADRSKKNKAPVKMAPSEQGPLVGEDHDEKQQHFRHKEAITSSILQTREEYATFHFENPGFFHVVLDSADACESFNTLESLAIESLIKYKQTNAHYSGLRGSVKSHAGMNKLDEEQFLAERLKHFKSCASVWSRGYDFVSASTDRRKIKDGVDKKCEIFFEKPHCQQNLLEPTIPRPGITLKMKRIVELHDKRIRCSKKSC